MQDERSREGSSFTKAVAERFGLLPNFFCSAPAAAGLIDELWAFAKSAYLDSPLPSLFKERLFVHLSRFCEVRYCIVRHLGFLLGEGRPSGDRAATPHTLAQALALLRRPVPDTTALDHVLGRLEAHAQPSELPAPETQAETDLFDALTVMFLVPQRSARARSGVQKAVGDKRFELLVAFLAFVRTAHYWTEMHPELAYEPDMCAVMERQPELARLLLATGEAETARANAELRQTIDDLHRAKGSLRESDARLRAVIAGIPQLVWQAVRGGEWTWASPQWTEYTGRLEENSLGFGWLDAVHPDDREKVVLHWGEAEHLGTFDIAYRLCHAADQRYRWFRTRAKPMRDGKGNVVEWLGTSTDVDNLRQMQERQEVLVAELQHRTRNLLAVVRSIASQTIRASETLGDFETAFSDRLTALSRVQGLLSRADGEPITMRALLGSELEALGAEEQSGRIVVQGPEVRLRKGSVQTFALALHELATNARKYGALATESGHLKVTWQTYADETGPRLALEWQETGLDREQEELSPTTKPGGYGRELIEQALPYALKARTTYDLGEAELRCTIDLPLAESTREN